MTLADRLPGWLRRQNRDESPETARQQQFGQLLASLMVMAWFVEARDPYTGGHLWRVSRYAHLLAQAADWSPQDAAVGSLGGFLHDLGKIGVPDAILRKPGGLSDQELAVIRTHPAMGAKMLSGHPLGGLVHEAVYLHHERPDGSGYPLGLRGEGIPLVARLVGICDAFDAMTSTRPYRRGMAREAALHLIREGIGRQFDAALGQCFVDLGREGGLDHVLGHSDDGIPLQPCPMCGPTIVVRKGQQAGDRLYCRSCGGEFVLAPGETGPAARPTGRVGAAQDLEPTADEDLIGRVLEAAVKSVSIPALMQQYRGRPDTGFARGAR